MYNDLLWISFLFMMVEAFAIAWNKTSDPKYQIPEWEVIQMNYTMCIFMYILLHFVNKWW